MKLKPYEAYKDSGVESLGSVPNGWILTRLKFIASSIKGKNPPEILDEQADGSLPYLSMDYLRGQVEPKFAYIDKSSCKVDDGKVLLLWDGANAGEFIKGKSGILSSTSALLNPSSTLQKDYFWFYCKTIEHDVRRQAIGMGIPHVNGDELKSTVFAKPSFDEQQQIATFLDRQTTKIDTLISKQEKLIALLQENRQAVILHAVTKGLNPDAPMKDSGVEWLGMVPTHWKVMQLRHMASIKNGSDYKHVECELGEYPVIGSGGEFKRASDYIYDGVSVLLGRKGTIDKPLYIEGKFWVVDTMFYTIIKDIVLPKYVFNCAKIIPFNLLSTGTALPSMTQNDLKQLQLALPESKLEQGETIAFIDDKTAKIDTLIEKAKHSIELSKEHRSALISAAVTGKIDVREAV